MAVSTCAAEERPAAGRNIARGKSRQQAFDLHFAGVRWQIELRLASGLRDIAEQIVDVGNAYLRQHSAPVVIGQREIAH